MKELPPCYVEDVSEDEWNLIIAWAKWKFLKYPSPEHSIPLHVSCLNLQACKSVFDMHVPCSLQKVVVCFTQSNTPGGLDLPGID